MKVYQVQLSVTTNCHKRKTFRENFMAINDDEALKFAKRFFQLKSDKYARLGKTFESYSCFIFKLDVVYHTFTF